jgi:hypothetical protein
MKDVVVEIRPFDDPVPPDVHDFDLVTFLFFYHDTTYMNVDRAEMNRKLFATLKPGGFLLIADHSALLGQGVSVGKTLHRIGESTLRQEVEAAGFRLANIDEGGWHVREVPKADMSNRKQDSYIAANMAKLTELLTTNAMHVGQGLLAGALIADAVGFTRTLHSGRDCLYLLWRYLT